MIKVRIVGSGDIKKKNPHSLRAMGYLKAFDSLGASAEYNCMKRFHYRISGGKTSIFYDGKIIGDVDLIFILSAAPKFILSYYELFKLLKTRTRHLINDPDAFLKSKNKFLTSMILDRAGVAVPQSWMVTGASWEKVIDELSFPVIVKKVIGSKGVGVMKFDSQNSLASFFDFYFSDNSDPQGLIIQDYIPESNATDFRVVVVNRKAIVTTMRKGLDPKKNFRSNLSQGAKPSLHKPEPALADLAIRATEALGLFISGVDIMKSKNGYKVLEVNGTPFIDNDVVERQVAGHNIHKTIARECLSLVKKTLVKRNAAEKLR